MLIRKKQLRSACMQVIIIPLENGRFQLKIHDNRRELMHEKDRKTGAFHPVLYIDDAYREKSFWHRFTTYGIIRISGKIYFEYERH